MTALAIDLAAAQLARATANDRGPAVAPPRELPRRPLLAAVRRPIRRPLASLAL